jgi:hypothetical protein
MRWSRQPSLGLMAAAAIVVAAAPLAWAGQRKDERKLERAQQQELQALIKLVDEIAAGQPAPADLPVSLHNDFLKALEGKTYVPFTVTVDPAKVGTTPLALYLRVVQRGLLPADAAKEKEKKKKDAPLYAFEDIHFIQPRPPEPGQLHRISRAFAVVAGEYDVYVAIRERPNATNTAGGSAPKTTVLKESMTVPNFWSSELATSTVIVAERVSPLSEPPSAERQAEHPYTLGTTEIVPALDATLTKKDDLSVLFLIYNPGLGPDKRPDLTVEYTFHRKEGESEKRFNRTEPQTFNSTTLPPQFDLAAGHQLVAGQSIPLASFPEGNYRLEIMVADKITGKSLTRNVAFTVTGP